jgi:hypothetical protein
MKGSYINIYRLVQYFFLLSFILVKIIGDSTVFIENWGWFNVVFLKKIMLKYFASIIKVVQ